MLNHDDRLPSVVIGLSFSNVISASNQQQSTTAPETAANHRTGIHTGTGKTNGTLDYSADLVCVRVSSWVSRIGCESSWLLSGLSRLSEPSALP